VAGYSAVKPKDADWFTPLEVTSEAVGEEKNLVSSNELIKVE